MNSDSLIFYGMYVWGVRVIKQRLERTVCNSNGKARLVRLLPCTVSHVWGPHGYPVAVLALNHFCIINPLQLQITES